MQRISIDGIEFNVTDNSIVETVSEMKDDKAKAKLMQVSDHNRVHIQYIRFQMETANPTVIIAGRDDDQFIGLLWTALKYGPFVLFPGEKITRSAFEERVNTYAKRVIDSAEGSVEPLQET